jgi:tetratricopeptide (TPR) repeat protein
MSIHNSNSTPLSHFIRCCSMTALILAGSILSPTLASAAPFLPNDDAEVLERLPTPGDADQRELRRLGTELSNKPNNLDLALRLARRYIQVGRAEADPRYYGYAEAVLKPWWNLQTPPVEVLVLRAVLAQARHAFDAALADLERVLEINPRQPQAWLTRAFILQVQGRPDEAGKSCGRLPSGIGPLVMATCRGRVESLSGRAAEGYARLEEALEGSPNGDKGLKLWALTNLAEIAERRGDRDVAERHFRDALALGLRNAYLLGAYSDYLLDGGRPAEVRDLLAGDIRVDALLLRLTLAETALGDPEAAGHVAALEARFAASRRRGDLRHGREEARFTLELLQRPAEALGLALENWQTQREPADARLVLEAARAAGVPDKAGPVLEWLEETGLDDAKIDALVQRLQEGEV